jgi:hypothetical protein
LDGVGSQTSSADHERNRRSGDRKNVATTIAGQFLQHANHQADLRQFMQNALIYGWQGDRNVQKFG